MEILELFKCVVTGSQTEEATTQNIMHPPLSPLMIKVTKLISSKDAVYRDEY